MTNRDEWLKRVQFAIDCVAPNASDAVKVKAMMNKLSETAFSEYMKFRLPQSVTSFNLAMTVEKLEKLFAKPQSIYIDRYECLMARRGEDEEFRSFVNRHKRLLTDFKFKDLKEQQFYVLMLLTALKSPTDAALRQRILMKLTTDGERITYDAVVEDCINYMATIAEAKVIEQPETSRHVYALKKRPPKHRERSENSSNGSISSKESQRSQSHINGWCWRCGKDHSPKRCAHAKSTCRKCSKMGHLERMCDKHRAWLKKNEDSSRKQRAVKTVRLGGLMLAKRGSQPQRLIKTPIEVEGKKVKFVLDTGAEGTVLNEEAHRLIGSPRLRRCEERAQLFDGSTRPFLGKGIALFSIGGQTQKRPFFVSKNGAKNLLGIDMMDSFGLLGSLRKTGASMAKPTQRNKIWVRQNAAKVFVRNENKEPLIRRRGNGLKTFSMGEESSDQRRRSPQLRADENPGRSRVRKHRETMDEEGLEARNARKAVQLPLAPTTNRTHGLGPIESKPVHSVQPKEALRAADDIMWSPFN